MIEERHRTAVMRAVLAFTLGFLLAFGAAQSAAPTRGYQRELIVTVRHPAVVVRDYLPPLPDSVISRIGWIKVHRPDPPFHCDLPITTTLWGCYVYATHTLSVVTGLSRWDEWFTLYHEMTHMLLDNADLRWDQRGDTSEVVDDKIADAIAAQRMLERLANNAQ